MGRSAKVVRTSAFEKQKRHDKGQEWRKSQWKTAREAEKVAKKEVKPDSAMDTDADDQHQEALANKVGDAMKFFNLADLAAKGGGGAFMEDGAEAGAAAAPSKEKKAKAKAHGKKKGKST
mmetsp:Transcript_68982/g.161641  ORF Transcript_68982/g.161641 Transcript_68982/m.161641 type:complete len:120 (-) Transcript_68982:22-381(-)